MTLLNKNQYGYMYEYPLMVMGTVFLLLFLEPVLPVWAAKIMVGLGAGIIIFGIHYMLLTPGWQPNAQRLRFPFNLILFVVITAGIIIGAVVYIVVR